MRGERGEDEGEEPVPHLSERGCALMPVIN